ncbi:MAG: helix-turn-helix domain-containing protein [Cytophagales bacterium]|nr:helix-turn-helix domain-containing protein [Cytophagales bacterium]
MSKEKIDACIRESLAAYFKDLDGVAPHNLYEMMLACFERPLLDAVMTQAAGNQSKAAQWLGVNRNTLRKKLTEYSL